MKNNPKEKKSGNQYLGFTGKSQQKSTVQQKKFLFFLNGDAGVITAGIIQIVAGLSIVGVTILGLLTPLWLSAVLSLIGSISSMFGVYLIFHSIAANGNFDTLINQSIKRVIRDQN
ncbi:hypothetical protein DYD21_11385 [Rhodohalobacter sp. SW132]|uniref:hypothetical protein n=1 Tax=Rhodohalobacter sp. SW132 TaxID=2293433 RepID=UPI000E246F47|nr:hypothetical protein [Rhodohalobacter sp. SW132]REL33374.1 hypothetical protein DYD21_11385 [Rhodohalobacter sp. SW132]